PKAHFAAVKWEPLHRFSRRARGVVFYVTDQRVAQTRKHAVPLPWRFLPEEMHGWIPGAILAIHQPPPVRHPLENHPAGPSERTGDMSDRCIGRYDKVEVFHHCKGVDEGVARGVEIISQNLDRKRVASDL